jgi:hypothetical protein
MRRGLSFCALPLLLSLASSARGQEKFALQLFHFNVQYVAGGTLGYSLNPDPILDLDNDAIEDLIVTESFAPIVDLFDAHPTWGVDLEMQAYLLDVLAARHPEVLDKLRALAKAGRVEVVSFHYADQLYIAYPEEDWERSQDLVAATFAKHDVPLGRSVFCQEGQAGPALAARLEERGYRTMVWPKNLWSFQHGDAEALPLYQFGNVFLVQGGKGFAYDDGNVTIDVTWTFLDDGELLATGDINPYFPDIFRHHPEEVAAYEADLLALERQGYRIVTVDEYVASIGPLATPAPATPPLLDGTWQPNSTNGVKKWLGGRGVWGAQERDNHVRTLGATAHRELVAAETVASAAGLDARERLDDAWRLLFLGQVSDASGINPFRGEVLYGLSHFTEALRIAREVEREGKAALGLGTMLVDPAGGTASEGSDAGLRGPATDPPLELLVDGGDRQVSQSWELLEPGHWRVAIDFGPGEFTNAAVTFPGEVEDTLALGAALADGVPLDITRADFTFESFHFALPTGWIGLGGGRFVVKDMGAVHLAAEVVRDSGDVTFGDETMAVEDAQHWVFHVFDGTAADAAKLAQTINATRRLVR